MAEVLALSLSFPSVVYTVLLGVVIVYWLFVMAGAIELGEGSEGALEGSAKGALEGSAKGVLEGSAKGVLEGHVGDAPDGGALDGDEPGALAALVSALRLRAVPATTVLSVLVTFSWLVSVVAMQVASRAFPSGIGFWPSAAVLFSAPVLSLPLAAVVLRPLSRVFEQRRATSRADLIGKTCVIRTGTVTHKFGEGTLEDGGAGLVIRVRVDGDQKLKRGEQALIVDWDAERESFLVEPMSDLLAPRKGR